MQRVLWLVWTVGIFAAVLLAIWRFQIESHYRTVAIIVDGMEVRTLQGLTGLPLPRLLMQLREAGATGVAVSSDFLNEWSVSGRVQVQPQDKRHWLVAPEKAPLEQVSKALKEQFGLVLNLQKSETGWRLLIPTPKLLTAPIGIGLDKELAQAANQAKIVVVARLPNPMGLTEEGVRFWLNEAKNANAFAVLFEGEEVLGFRTMLKEVADALRQSNLQVGILELVSQRGDKALASSLPDRVVRVHSVSVRELPNFTMPELVNRFVRAVRERNIRLCYLRFPTHLKGEPITIASEYLAALRTELQQNGFLTGVPSSLSPPSSPSPLSAPLSLWVIVWLGAVITGIAFLCLFLPLTVRQQWTLTFVIGALGIGLHIVSPIWAAKLAALGLTIIAPIIAIWFGSLKTLRSGSRSARTAAGLATCLCVIVACGLMEAALLFDSRFWLKVSEFSGVKLSQLLPLLLVIAIVAGHWFDTIELPFSERISLACQRFRSFQDAPVRWGQAVALLIFMAIVAYWIMRTGNEPFVGVGAWEMKLRAIFEDLLGVRPRFKEFALGIPALVLSFYFLTGRDLENRIGKWLMVPAVIGLASIMNTFSHAHTPIALSLLRTAHGIWLGILLGILVIVAVHLFSRLRDRRIGQSHCLS